MNLKICAMCHQNLSDYLFNKDSSISDGLARYCRKCINIYQKKRKHHPEKIRVTEEKECLVCNKLFVPNNVTQKYCNSGCSRTANGVQNISYYKKCAYCSSWFITSRPLHSFCSAECSKSKRSVPNESIQSSFVREYYLEKFNFTCQVCQTIFPWPELHCHHLLPLSLGGDDAETNITVLCRTCHAKQHNVATWRFVKNNPEFAHLF
jgi:5-methylcytosine-specific restriction endonuclease McrA